MAHQDIPDAAVTAGARATAYLMRRLRDNMRASDYYRQAIAYMLDAATGHRHGTGTVPFTFNFSDRIEVKTGSNDRLPFRFGSGTPSYPAAPYSATLTAGVYTFSALVTEMQTKMRAAVDAGSPSSVPLIVGYDPTPGSKFRGRFGFGHTEGTTSSARVLEILFGTGTGFATSVATSIGFAKRDLKKALSYVGTSGFIDGFLEETFSLSEGGLLESADFQAGAFTTAKFTNTIIPTGAFQNSSVSGGAGGKIASGAIRYDKLGPAVTVASSLIGAGATHTFDFALSSGGSGRTPQVALSNHGSPGCLSDQVYITSISFSGGQWHVVVRNASAGNQDVAVAAY